MSRAIRGVDCLYLPSVGKTRFRDTFRKIFFQGFLKPLHAIAIELSPGRLQRPAGLLIGLFNKGAIPACFVQAVQEDLAIPLAETRQIRQLGPVDTQMGPRVDMQFICGGVDLFNPGLVFLRWFNSLSIASAF